MRYTEALEKISRVYIPGCVKFYEGKKPDPWQAAHNRMEVAIKTEDWQSIESAAKTFLAECLVLLDSFRKESKPGPITSKDALEIGNPERLEALISVQDGTCYVCKTPKNLTVMNSDFHADLALVICRECRKLKGR